MTSGLEGIASIKRQWPTTPVLMLSSQDEPETARLALELLHQGLSNKLIARKLVLPDNTVRRNVQDILEYFQAVNRSEAIFAARQQALVS